MSRCGIAVLAALQVLSPMAPDVAAERPEPRRELSAEERSSLIARLREDYAKPAAEWPAPTVDDGVEWVELGKLPKPTHPNANPGTPQKIQLGKQLFFDPRLSGSKQIACASCHDPDLGWADGRTTSFGHYRKLLERNAPSILNSAYRKAFFWDGRAATLEEQAVAVLNNADEMHSSANIVVANIAGIPAYAEQFEEAFAGEADQAGREPTATVSFENAIKAIAAYERTIVGGRSRFDYFLGGRHKALTDTELAGLHLFRTTARCMNCHHGPLLSDEKFHNLGLSNYGRRFEDLGRYKVTGNREDVGAFRTPSLRNVANTRPYMHGGAFSLDEALVLYNAGMPNPRRRKSQADDPLFPIKSTLLKPLHLNATDFADLKAFLGSLSEPHVRVAPPELPDL